MHDAVNAPRSVGATVLLGASQAEGGSRIRALSVGGRAALPYMDETHVAPPVIAAGFSDVFPDDAWPAYARTFNPAVCRDPFRWLDALLAGEPDAVCVRLKSCHPDEGNNGSDYAAGFVTELLRRTSLPVIVLGCDHPERDCEVLPAICRRVRGERLLVGMATKDNYREIAAAAMDAGHAVIAQTPLDINLAKQLNILINDAGMPLDRIVMHHTTGGLGYGFEYCYSIMERCRQAASQGDAVMSVPIMNLVNEETWKTKEARADAVEEPGWGTDPVARGVIWETVTAMAYIHAGADILVLSHPESMRALRAAVRVPTALA
jgi:acetyl-CoA decarbonylase/synthase complex subunit delta